VFGEPRRPYRPVIESPVRPVGGPTLDKSRPWLALRDGETALEWHQRVAHTCWKCGTFIVDPAALDAHESEHNS
jgi:hypothetical protein